MGIVKAAKFPVNSPGVSEFPTITKTPVIAKDGFTYEITEVSNNFVKNVKVTKK